MNEKGMKSTIEFNRRELASIRAGLKLLHKFERQTSRNFSLCRIVDAISSENDTIEPLTDGEVEKLFWRLERAAGRAESAGAVEEAKVQA